MFRSKTGLIVTATAIVILSSVIANAKYSGGAGSLEDPYQIANADDLLELAATTEDYDKNFILTADIDLDPNLPGGQVFSSAVIAPDTYFTEWSNDFDGVVFTGVFDGAGHKISNLTINTSEAGNDYLGLFGRVNDGEIKNLVVEGISITCGDYSKIIGGIAGWVDVDENITSCYSTGNITCGEWNYYIGGLAGLIEDSFVSDCHSDNNIAIGDDSHEIGGLAGINEGGVVSNSYSTGAITVGNRTGTTGGLVGNNWGSIETCYSNTIVTGNINSAGLGGVTGTNGFGSDINNCYSTGTISGKEGSSSIGGFTGENGGSISNCHSTGEVKGGNNSFFLGGLSGANSQGTISNCHSTGAVTGEENSWDIGGLAGNNTYGNIEKCYSTGDVAGGDGATEIGGLVGQNNEYTISECYSTGAVSGGNNSSDIGGLAGKNCNSIDSDINNCYSRGAVSGGENSSSIGGLAGESGSGKLSHCYATGTIDGGSNSSNLGGLVGSECGGGAVNPFRCYFISGGFNNGLGTPLSDEQMKHQSSFYHWDFVGESDNGTEDIWKINEGVDYPELAWQEEEGNLEVTLGPEGAVTAGAQWNVDGGVWQNSGDTVNDLAVGLHTVNYKAVSGWDAPASEQVTITDGQTNSISRNYIQQIQDGNLLVTLGPAGAVTAGAQWNVDGGVWQNGGDTVNDLAVGLHTVNYKAVSGWDAPASEQVTITDGQTNSISRNYIQQIQDGNLQVTLGPAGAVTAGAQWNVDGGGWQISNATVTGLSVGSHTVNYKDINGWDAPSSEQITITNGQTTSFNRNYTQQQQQAGNLQVILGPAGAITDGAQWNVDWGAWQNGGNTVSGLSVGWHTVYYKSITGWDAPAVSEPVSITNGQTTQISRNYIQQQSQHPQFGILNGKSVKITLKDAYGNDVTFSLAGAGYGEVTGGANFDQIILYGTGEKSALTISTKAKDVVSVGDIICNGPMKGITAKGIDVTGNIEIGSPAIPNPKAAVTIVMDEASELTINSDMPIKSITATEWVGGAINAPSVASLTIKGDKKRGISGDLGDVELNLSKEPDVKVMALGKLTVKGWIDSSRILSKGNIGTVTAGGIIESSCFAGIMATSDVNFADGVPDLPGAEATNFNGTVMIKSFAIKGIKTESAPYVINSNIAAANISGVTLSYPQNTNGGVPFGLSAGFIKSVKIKDAEGTTSFKNLDKPGDSLKFDDAEIRLY